MFDSVQRAREVEKIVCRDGSRKYYRFRAARFYGGIATADCVGCCLSCIFCWAWDQVHHPATVGRFYGPEEVATTLTAIARRRHFKQVRVSGNEPTLGRAHLLGVIAGIPRDLTFVLETNGILIGDDPRYAQDLAAFPNLYVRVSLKGTSGEEFSRLTGARPDGFRLQLQAVESLWRAGVAVRPAVMVSFSPEANVEALRARLAKIDPAMADIEREELVLYGDVRRRLEQAGLAYRSAHAPRAIPPEQI